MSNSPQADLHTVLSFAKAHGYQSSGRIWQKLISSLAFETKFDLSLIQYFGEIDQARLFTILEAFMSKELEVFEIRNFYLEFFLHPETWEEIDEN